MSTYITEIVPLDNLSSGERKISGDPIHGCVYAALSVNTPATGHEHPTDARLGKKDEQGKVYCHLTGKECPFHGHNRDLRVGNSGEGEIQTGQNCAVYEYATQTAGHRIGGDEHFLRRLISMQLNYLQHFLRRNNPRVDK